MPVRNNVTRLLDARGTAYEAIELPPGKKRSAQEAAALLGVPPETVYKTIVVVRERGGKPILCMVPAPSEVNLKKLASELGEKKLHLPTQREAEQLTGLQAGGISPLALLHKGFQVCLDRAAEHQAHIHVSGGQRGLLLRMAVADLVALTSARWVDATSSA